MVPEVIIVRNKISPSPLAYLKSIIVGVTVRMMAVTTENIMATVLPIFCCFFVLFTYYAEHFLPLFLID
jgi:hypothetical protein